MRAYRVAAFAVACSIVGAVTAGAQTQASIAGIVKDMSGAILPGVVVEAASPVLIERTRSATTDSTGQYKIVNLPPGAYTVTFTLSGFQSTKREGVELVGTATSTVNADLRVGDVSETVTVSGEAPLVDVQSPSIQTTVTKQVIDAIPTPRIGVSLAALIPGMVTFNGNGPGGVGQGQRSSLTDQDVGGQNGDVFTDLSIHGSRPGDMRTMWNGLSVATQIRFGESTSSAPSMTAFQEVAIDTSGADATISGGGVRLNYIPRDGGNTWRGVSFISYAGTSMRSSNDTPELREKGLPKVGNLKLVYDVNPGIGGPIVRNKLWFFATVHALNAQNYLPGNFPNANATKTDASQWKYVADTGKGQNYSNGFLREETIRLAWQVNRNNKIGFYYADKYRCTCLHPGATTSNEAMTNAFVFDPFNDQWGEWSSPVTNRLLLEAGIFRHGETWGNRPPPSNLVDPTRVGVFDIAPPAGQVITTYHGVVGNVATPSTNPNYRSRFAVSYITGSHTFKTGFDQSWSSVHAYSYTNLPYSYTFFGGQPFSITEYSNTFPDQIDTRSNVKADGGAFAQDSWRHARLTAMAGVRFDWFNSYLPAYSVGPSILTPNRNVSFDKFTTLDWKDLTPKFGMAYDVTGDARTALKVSLGKYVLGQGGAFGNGLSTNGPAQGLQTTTSRTWNDNFFGPDDPRSGNFVPDCDLLNPALSGECGPWANPAFGSALPVQGVDPDLRYGWGKRQYNWEFGVSAQRQIGTGMSVYGGYYRRWYGNFYVVDNLAVSASDYDSYSLTAPTAASIANAAQLPEGGGYGVGPYYVIHQDKFSVAPQNITSRSNKYGKQIDHWNGFDFGFNARGLHGFVFQGGVSTGSQLLDTCDIVAKVPEALFQSTDFFAPSVWQQQGSCRVSYPWLTQLKFLTGYTLPKVDVQIGATLQSIPGFERLAANWQVPNATISSVIGRPVPGAGPGNSGSTAVNVLLPGEEYGDRLNQLDLRFGKVLRFTGTRSIVSADLFNVFNSSIVTNESRALTTYQQPLAVIGARLLKLSWQFDF
ncbi:MAG TPA: carboxypeptidase regulatory-like domain-containing protein [Vicinamibacterales bacterium]|nr:carboxypeptidase regulatory-like domain-containing protein [Vicinamibacterales bacterium]